jgi:DNA (cytosine-5)-methyltransferase 1
VSARGENAKKTKAPLVGVVDFFAGCGGTSLGFRRAGLSIIAGLDSDQYAGATYRRNFPRATFLESRIEDVDPQIIKEILRNRKTRHVLLCGCAPCQPFSRIGSRSSTDKRTALLDHFGRMVDAIKPSLLFVENVPGLQQTNLERGPLRRLISILERSAYDYSVGVVASQEYGVPQMRRRLILMGSRLGPIAFPKPTHGPGRPNPQFSTVWEWIGHLPPLEAGQEHPTVPNHRAAILSEINLRRISSTPVGGGRDDWPKDLILDCHNNHDGHTDVYGRMHKDRPASALTTRCISLSNGRFGHPEQDRAISVREAALLQTFPDDFVFEGTFHSTAQQVGNAVPVLLAERFGKAIMRHVRSFELRKV